VLLEMDRQFGKIFDHIRNNPELRDNTLVIICSDNGPEPGAGTAGPFRGAKTTLYEGGTRSPLIAWGPGIIDKTKAGTENEKSVFAAFDLVPSLLTITGTEKPTYVHFDGEDIAPVLLGQSTTSRSQPIYWRRPPDRKNWLPYISDPQPDLAMREGDWKLLCDYDGTQPQLYDLAYDRSEVTNLAAKYPEIVARLTKALLAWHQSMPPDHGPDIPAEKPIGKGKQK